MIEGWLTLTKILSEVKQSINCELYEPVFLGDELAPTCLCVRSKYNVDESGSTDTIPDKRNNASSKGGNTNEHEWSKPQLGVKDIFSSPMARLYFGAYQN